MSRVRPGNYTKSPVERYIDWNGASDGGYFYFYDPEHEDSDDAGNVRIMPLYFLYLDHTAKVGGWNDDEKSYLFSNMVRNPAKEKFKVRTIKDKKLLAEGIWKTEIKPTHMTAGQNDAKYGNLVYAYDPKNDEIIGINMFGSAFSEWFKFRNKYAEQMENDFAIGIEEYTDQKNGSVEYRQPTMKTMKVVKTEHLEKAYKAGLKVDNYLQAYFSMSTEEKEQGVSLMDLCETFKTADELAAEWSGIVEEIKEHEDCDQLMMVYKARGQNLGIQLNDDGTVDGAEVTEEEEHENLSF